MVVFLLVLTILTTTLALATRTTAGLYAQSYQSKLRLAKDAAENGLTIVASDLNYPGNRIIFGKNIRSSWAFTSDDQPNYRTSVVGGDVQDQVQPCFVYQKGGRIGPPIYSENGFSYEMYYPSSTFSNIFKKSESQRYYIGNGQSYRPIDYNFYDSDHREATEADYAQVNYISVVVEGSYNSSALDKYSLGDAVPTEGVGAIDISKDVKYTIQQEFQIVPRCCSLGFGKVNGIKYGPSTVDITNDQSCDLHTLNTQTEWILRSVSRTSALNAKASPDL